MESQPINDKPDAASHVAHTPGPWIADGHITRDLDGTPISVLVPSGRPASEWTPNAHLIAAAPELLASCKELREALAALMRVCYASPIDLSVAFGEELAMIGAADGFGVRAQAAIAKAEGR